MTNKPTDKPTDKKINEDTNFPLFLYHLSKPDYYCQSYQAFLNLPNNDEYDIVPVRLKQQPVKKAICLDCCNKDVLVCDLKLEIEKLQALLADKKEDEKTNEKVKMTAAERMAIARAAKNKKV